MQFFNPVIPGLDAANPCTCTMGLNLAGIPRFGTGICMHTMVWGISPRRIHTLRILCCRQPVMSIISRWSSRLPGTNVTAVCMSAVWRTSLDWCSHYQTVSSTVSWSIHSTGV